ncbi:MAG TPA: BamA/TamA family outer membrane protein [Acetobacteraceae bacterium]|nr:BamA/TamA family outer membrane protein [Acetobacteraceae bacterium]
MLRRATLLLAGIVIATGDTVPGRAADPQPYTVMIMPTGIAGIDGAAQETSTLQSLNKTGPVGPFALVERARSDQTRLDTVLNSFGYYAGSVAITIEGRPLDDPTLVDRLDAVPPGTSVPVVVTMTPGPLFRIGTVQVSGDVPPDARGELNLATGQPAVASDVLAAHDRLLNYLQSTGHALATVSTPVATLETGSRSLNIAMTVDAGPRVDLGEITITGLKDVNVGFIRRTLPLNPGEQYDPAKLQAAREDLAAQGVFSSVAITTPDHLAENGTLPVMITVVEGPKRVVSADAAYSTDLGIAAGASWTHRNLFGNAEQLTLRANATEVGGGTDAKQPGYIASATLLFPAWLRRDQTLTLNTTALKQYLKAYNQTALIAGVTVARTLTPNLKVSVGLTGEEEKITQEEVGRNYTLLQVPLTATFDNTGSIFDPTHGVRANVTLTPTESFRNPQTTFLIAQATASTYFNLGEPGRSVLAVRGLIGSIQGASTLEIPADQRFYAGGTGTVRGYRYQSVGPRFPDGVFEGGTSIDAGSVEFRQRFGESFGGVVFVDAAQVGSNGKPFSGTPRVGTGFGVRYYTSIGPIRADLAFPVNPQKKADPLEFYVGIGQAF